MSDQEALSRELAVRDLHVTTLERQLEDRQDLYQEQVKLTAQLHRVNTHLRTEVAKLKTDIDKVLDSFDVVEKDRVKLRAKNAAMEEALGKIFYVAENYLVMDCEPGDSRSYLEDIYKAVVRAGVRFPDVYPSSIWLNHCAREAQSEGDDGKH